MITRRLLAVGLVVVALVGAACDQVPTTTSVNPPTTATPPTTEMSTAVKTSVPSSLFGVELGGRYTFPRDLKNAGTLPVKAIRGSGRFLGEGWHLYFEPKLDNPTFVYKEKRRASSDEYFETSHHLYVLPVVPPSVQTLQQLVAMDSQTNVEVWVQSIDWDFTAKSKDEAYYWAMDMCKTFAADLGKATNELNHYESRTFKCTFAAPNAGREFYVESLGDSKRVVLEFDRQTSERNNDEAEQVRRRLEAVAIKPYP
jgi:hypothetical protein